MEFFDKLVNNKCIIVPLILWAVIQSFKVITDLVINKKLNVKRIIGSVEKIAKSYGKPIIYKDKTYYLFPTYEELKNITMAKIKYLFCDDEDSVYNMLLDFVINNNIWGKAIDLVEIKNYINKKNMRLCNLAFDKKVAPTIDRLNREYDTFFIPINNEMVKREEFRKSKNNFISSNSNTIIIKFNAEKWNNQKYSKYN